MLFHLQFVLGYVRMECGKIDCNRQHRVGFNIIPKIVVTVFGESNVDEWARSAARSGRAVSLLKHLDLDWYGASGHMSNGVRLSSAA